MANKNKTLEEVLNGGQHESVEEVIRKIQGKNDSMILMSQLEETILMIREESVLKKRTMEWINSFQVDFEKLSMEMDPRHNIQDFMKPSLVSAEEEILKLKDQINAYNFNDMLY